MKAISAKAVALTAGAIACTVALSACGGQATSTTNANVNKTEPVKVKVGYDKNKFEEGQSYTDTNVYLYIFKNAFDKLGWDAEFVGVGLTDVEKSINDGTIDCYAYAYTIQGREDKYSWTEAYNKATPVLMHKKNNPQINYPTLMASLASLENKPTNQTIAIPAGAMTYEDLTIEDKATLDQMGTVKEYPGLLQCKEALDKGEVDMVLTELAFIRPLFFSEDYGRLTMTESDTNTYGVAFKKGNDTMAKQMTDALKSVWADGSIKSSLETVLRNSTPVVSEENIRIAYQELKESWLLKDKIVVGYASDNYGTGEGQGFKETGNYNAYIKPVLEDMGWEVELKGIAYADIEESINNGTIDCFWDNYTIQGREHKYAWSEGYMTARPAISWKLANNIFGTTDGVSNISSVPSRPTGKTIAVKAGSVTYADMSAEQKAIVDSMGTVKEYPGLAQCKEALENGEVDMILTESALLAPLLVNTETYRATFFGPSENNSYGVAFKKGNEDKAETVTKTLKNAYATGTIKTSYMKYLKTNLRMSDADAEQTWEKFDADWLLK